MSATYQRFIKLLEKWPVDKSKSGRDLGEYLRKQAQLLSNPVSSTQDYCPEEINKELESLERLANNFYANKYKRLRDSTATGLTAQQCNQVLSSEFLQYLNEGSDFFKKENQ